MSNIRQSVCKGIKQDGGHMEKYDIDDEFDPSYMRRAIELARRGTGAAEIHHNGLPSDTLF